MNKKYSLFIMLLIVVLAISSYFFIKEIAENNKEKKQYTDLQTMVYSDIKVDDLNKEDMFECNLRKMYDLNNDLIGWIKIDGTNIDYPIMQNKDYYLYRNFYKEYSSHGTPYLEDSCNIDSSDNLIIYGHHMNDNSMFSQLDNFKKKSFYNNHKFIKFYTIKNGITEENLYEIVLVFKTVVYAENSFEYYKYINFYNEEEFKIFNSKCNDLKLYNTDSTMDFTDHLITLSTCEYSQKNGRMVIIAKKI